MDLFDNIAIKRVLRNADFPSIMIAKSAAACETRIWIVIPWDFGPTADELWRGVVLNPAHSGCN